MIATETPAPFEADARGMQALAAYPGELSTHWRHLHQLEHWARRQGDAAFQAFAVVCAAHATEIANYPRPPADLAVAMATWSDADRATFARWVGRTFNNFNN